MSRIIFVFLLIGVLSVSSTAPTDSFASGYGADANATGSPVGGGEGYLHFVTEGDYQVRTAEELVASLAKAKPGEVVYVLPDVEINLTGYQGIVVPAGVTLAGNRGEAGSPGPLLYTDDLSTRPLLLVPAPGVRITGLRIQGPDPETRESAYEAPNSEAIRLAVGAEVDNCEIYNWSYGGVYVTGEGAHIHHNFIHHVQRAGLGYPVSVNGGTALIEANEFDWYRHAIASSGAIGSGYEARYNIVGPNATSHAFDMHGGGDFCPKRSSACTPRETYMAGEWIRVHHNTFHVTKQRAIRVRGVPVHGAEVYRNRFSDSDPERAYSHVYFFGNASVYDNLYGPELKLVETWLTPSPLVRPCRRNPCTHPEDLGSVTTLLGPEVQFEIGSPRGERVRGSLPMSLLWEAAGHFATDSVEVRLDDEVRYEGDSVPAPGDIVIDTTRLSEGVHALVFSVTDDRYGSITKRTTFTVDNRYELVDRMMPPYQGGWFGTVDLSRTSAKSDGWVYDTDLPELFGGDSGRLRPIGKDDLGREYLQWETPKLRSYGVILYARGFEGEDAVVQAVSRRIQLVGSADGEVWEALPYELTADSQGDDEWLRIVAEGRIEGATQSDGGVAHFRILVDTIGGLPQTEELRLQVGEARFEGWH